MEADRLLRQVERNTWGVLLTMVAVALLVPPRPAVAVAVAGGGGLAVFSYWSLKRSLTTLVEVLAGPSSGTAQAPKSGRRELGKLLFRYALLGFLAYVMIARLRLHPWGLLAGASSVVAAVSLEAARLVLRKP